MRFRWMAMLGLAAACAPVSPPGPAADAPRLEPEPETLSGLQGEVEVSLPAPGRYATLVSYAEHTACSESWGSFTSTASLLLDLAEDGGVTACRGRQAIDIFSSWDDEPTEVQIFEQQGFVGTWTRQGEAWIEVRLLLDDTPCPQIRAYDRDPAVWTLRCTHAEPRDHLVLGEGVLACAFTVDGFAEGFGYAVPNVLPGNWVLLGPGNGLIVEATEGGSTHQSRIQPAPTALGPDAWTTRTPARLPAPGPSGPRVLGLH